MLQKYSTWKVFSEFARNPKKTYQIRELSRILKLATTSIKLHIEELEKEGLLLKERVGVYDAYRSNFDNEHFRFYKKISNLLEIKNSGLIEELEKQTTPDAIVIFGSYSRGEDIESSDIDIFMIAKEKEIKLDKYEEKLRRPIQLFFSENLNKLPKELLNNMLNGFVISGFVRWSQ